MVKIGFLQLGERVHDESPTRHVREEPVSQWLRIWVTRNVAPEQGRDLPPRVVRVVGDSTERNDLVLVVFALALREVLPEEVDGG